MDLAELGATALRGAFVYIVLLIMLRLVGKRTLGNLTAFDFIITLVLGRVAAEPITGRVPMIQALVGVVVIAGMHYVNAWLGSRSPRFDKLTGGQPRELIHEGTILHRALRKEQLSEAELWSLLRQKRVAKIEEVDRAILEIDGKLSVFKNKSRPSAPQRSPASQPVP